VTSYATFKGYKIFAMCVLTALLLRSFLKLLLWSSLLLVKEQREDNIKKDFQETLEGKHGLD
jgi:F0F1-type ATP synthase membrane subunit b/b'